MKKEFFLIGMLFLMVAFVSGANLKTDVDIGAKIECESLNVDQMATIYDKDNEFKHEFDYSCSNKLLTVELLR